MKKKTQKQISEETGIAVSTISNIKAGRRRPSWAYAKLLADCTRTKPALWLDGTPEQIRAAIK